MKKIALLIALICLTTTARAQPGPEVLYTEGQAAYDRHDYATAIAKWQAAYALSKESGLLFNLAQAQRLAGNCTSALASYRGFLATDPAAGSDQRKLADEFAKELDEQCPTAKPVVPALTAPKTAISDPADSVGPREQPRPMTASSSSSSSSSSGRRWKIAGLATSGVGIVTLAIGLGLGRHGSAIGAEITAACRTSCDWSALKDKDVQGRREVTIGRVLDVAGIAAIAGGAIFYYVGHRRQDIAITPRDGGAVVAWSRSW
jgi:tetratricopeptide (TPR) repeat protein